MKVESARCILLTALGRPAVPLLLKASVVSFNISAIAAML